MYVRMLYIAFIFAHASAASAQDREVKPISGTAWTLMSYPSVMGEGLDYALMAMPVGETFRPFRDVLTFRCAEGKFSAKVVLQQTVRPDPGRDNMTSVFTRIGREPPKQGLVEIAVVGQGVIWNDRQAAVTLATDIMTADRFAVRVETLSFGTKDIVFDTSNLASAIKPLRESCDW